MTVLVLTTLIFGGSPRLSNAQTYKFTFDPVQFYDYQPVSSSWSTAGGMFKLEPQFGVEPMYRSWTTADRPTVDQFTSGLGENEGIGAFSVYLFPTGSTSLFATTLGDWGQTLTGSASSSISAASAPAGWTAAIDSQVDPSTGTNAWHALFTTDNPANYIRPGNSLGDFSFDLANVAATSGTNYTFWLGESNYGLNPADMPAVVFSSPFSAQADSGFETTLSIKAVVPEPGTAVLYAAGIGFAIAIAGWRRWRKRIG